MAKAWQAILNIVWLFPDGSRGEVYVAVMVLGCYLVVVGCLVYVIVAEKPEYNAAFAIGVFALLLSAVQPVLVPLGLFAVGAALRAAVQKLRSVRYRARVRRALQAEQLERDYQEVLTLISQKD